MAQKISLVSGSILQVIVIRYEYQGYDSGAIGVMANHKNGRGNANFKTISQDDLPFGRKGKHNEIVHQLLSDLELLEAGRAIKIPVAELPSSKANIRSALSRATRNQNVEIVTSSDDSYFYIWKPKS